MASFVSFSEEAVFSRPICLEVFISPVSTTCGHNFCRTCITKFWFEQDRYKCPVCNELFHTRPALWVNTFISGMAAEFTRSVRHKVPCVEPGDVPCEVCTGTKLKAVKSCLNCQTSCCHAHLEPHQRVAGLRRHRLVEPMDRLEDRLCTTHSQLLELFCQTEQVFVCQICTEMGHTFHPFVPLKEECKIPSGVPQGRLQETLNTEMRQLRDAELRSLRQYEVDVTLDPCTADPQLVPSGDGKTKQGFSSGRFCFEVQTGGKTEWEVGVARRSANRVGRVTSSPENGYWTISLRNKELVVNCDPGVGAMVHLYSATGCTFTEPLHPILTPGLYNGGQNPASLIITPVNHRT
ncbi:E3 ubiquitin-protein ligase TRIM47-like, partial [Gadus chalcogrammus]|uniref:E3 ubiquitin-protein ligase TRIM47-like n=1 Tax=Gadus chalcogrammus TaxID=1042646 RepID=UPI0024C413EB